MAINALIQNLTYFNGSDTPTADRTLVLNVTDAAGAELVPYGQSSFAPLAGAANPLDGIDPGDRSIPTFVDLDADGDLDLVSGIAYGGLSVWTNTGGVHTQPSGAANPLGGIAVGFLHAPGFGDLDSDGDADLVLGALDGTFKVWTNADGVFTAQTGTANPFDGFDVGDTSTPTFVDLDGDGDLDLVSGENDGTFKVWTNAGGVFTAQTGAANPFNGIDVGRESTSTLTDLDGDGDMDLVSGAEDGTLKVWTDVVGVFTAQTDAANPFNGIDFGLNSAPSFVDLDGDGDLDLVAGAHDGTLRVWTNAAGVYIELTGAANRLGGIDVGMVSVPSFVDLDGLSPCPPEPKWTGWPESRLIGLCGADMQPGNVANLARVAGPRWPERRAIWP